MDEQAWYSSYSLLVATPGPLKIDVNRLRERLNAEAVRRDLEPYGLHTPAGFLDTFICAEDTLRRWVGQGAVNTDDLPYTQYETRYTKGIVLNNADFIEPMEDIRPYLTETGDELQAAQLRDELTIRSKVNRLVLMGALEKGYAMLPDDVRYRKMRQLYEDGPRYIHNLAGIYWDNPRVLSSLAELRQAWPDGVGAAAPIYKQILMLDPKNIIALNTLGTLCIDAGLAQTAEDYLRRAISYKPDFASAHFNLAILLEKTGRHAEALQELQKAAHTSNDEKVMDKFGLSLASEGRVDESVKWFKRAVEIRPTYTTARLHLALALHQTGRSEDALKHLNYVLKMNPQDETALGMLAKINGSGKSSMEDEE